VTARTAKPLPECAAPDCGRPVRRQTYLANGGLCTEHRIRRERVVQLALVDPEDLR
jgi:hypothetical protein